jgi:hypothetical protein
VERADSYGVAHHKPGNEVSATAFNSSGPAVGRLTNGNGNDNWHFIVDGVNGAQYGDLYVKGYGDGAGGTDIGQSVTPAVISFTAPSDGYYDISVDLAGREDSGWCGVRLYRNAELLAEPVVGTSGPECVFEVDKLEMNAGDRVHVVVEGWLVQNWCEMVIRDLRIRYDGQAAARNWVLYEAGRH